MARLLKTVDRQSIGTTTNRRILLGTIVIGIGEWIGGGGLLARSEVEFPRR